MKQDEMNTLFGEFTNLQREVLLKKNEDYAAGDALSNFKTAGAITQMGSEMNALNLISVKVARLGVLLNSKKSPNNESIQDTVLDLANYAFLLHAILSEKP